MATETSDTGVLGLTPLEIQKRMAIDNQNYPTPHVVHLYINNRLDLSTEEIKKVEDRIASDEHFKSRIMTALENSI